MMPTAASGERQQRRDYCVYQSAVSSPSKCCSRPCAFITATHGSRDGCTTDIMVSWIIGVAVVMLYDTSPYHGQLRQRHATSVRGTWTCVRFHPEHCCVVRNYSWQGALGDVVVLVEPTLTRSSLLAGTSPACCWVVATCTTARG